MAQPPHALSHFAAAIWLGSFTAIGVWVVPTLFQVLDKSLAGQIGARLFSVQSSVSLLAVAAIWLGLRKSALRRSKLVLFALLLAVVAALLQEYAIAPQIIAKTNPALWHRLGGLAFAMQWLCAAVLLWQMTGPKAYANQS